MPQLDLLIVIYNINIFIIWNFLFIVYFWNNFFSLKIFVKITLLNLTTALFFNSKQLFQILALGVQYSYNKNLFLGSSNSIAIFNFYEDLMAILSFIFFFVFYIILFIVLNFKIDNKITKNETSIDHYLNFNKVGLFYSEPLIEFIWTIFPTIIIIIMAIPSFQLLYSINEVFHPQLTLKVIGNQWYWRYEYSDKIPLPVLDELVLSDNIWSWKDKVVFDSYLKSNSQTDLAVKSNFRLLAVTKSVYLPTQTFIRLVITSNDVIHSWAIPGLGLKIDACPGRLNVQHLYIENEFTYFGQCSELCGVLHGFMPIQVDAVNIIDYFSWLKLNLIELFVGTSYEF